MEKIQLLSFLLILTTGILVIIAALLRSINRSLQSIAVNVADIAATTSNGGVVPRGPSPRLFDLVQSIADAFKSNKPV